MVELAQRPEVERLHLFQRAPPDDEDAIDEKLAQPIAKRRELGTATEIVE